MREKASITRSEPFSREKREKKMKFIDYVRLFFLFPYKHSNKQEEDEGNIDGFEAVEEEVHGENGNKRSKKCGGKSEEKDGDVSHNR